MVGPLLPFGSASALLRSGHSSLPLRSLHRSVGDADGVAVRWGCSVATCRRSMTDLLGGKPTLADLMLQPCHC